MKRLIRLARELWFAISSIRNSWTYIAERCGWHKEGEIHVTLQNGVVFALKTNTNHVRMIEEIWHAGAYDALLSRVRDESVVVDIGANIGIFSVKAARAARGVRVVSYEPFPENFALLEENMKMNVSPDLSVRHATAVSGRGGLETLYHRPRDSGGVSVYRFGDQAGIASFQAPSVSLADVFRENVIQQCHAMKIDCEGAEKDILLSAPRDLFGRIAALAIEWHAPLHGMNMAEGMRWLASLGYRTRYDPATFVLFAWRR